VYVSTQLDPFVAGLIESYGRETTGTDVRVGGVDIALTAGNGKVGDLTIGNPSGFDTDYFLRVNDIDLSLDLASLGSAVPVVREIVVDGAHLNAEQRGDATNLTEIQSYMTRSGEAAPSSEPAEPGRVIINQFRLTNGRVTLTSELLSKPEDIELEDVVVNGIGRDSGGATYDEATEAVLTPILGAARAAVQSRLQDAAADAAREEVEEEVQEKASERLNELLNRE
jgi:uncharacterized protein involved in outer membrane biogenesis